MDDNDQRLTIIYLFSKKRAQKSNEPSESNLAERAERLLSWRHTGFNVHSRVRAKTKKKAERVGKYMIRPLLCLERLSLDEREGQVRYQYGKEAKETERMDYLEFIARVVSHIPDKGQVTVRYYGL